MAKSVTGQKSKPKRKSIMLTLIEKLTVSKDISINRLPIETGRIRYCWKSLSSSFSSMVGVNLLTLLFFLPAVFIIFFLVPALEQQIVKGANFVGDIGLGFTGATNDTINAIRAIYEIRISWMALVIPCMTLAGVGMAGAFYCARNRVWGAKIKSITHFFRGVKKYWWQYMIAFTVIGLLGYSVYASITNHLLMATFGNAPAWSYVVMIVLCIISLLTLIFMLSYLGNINMYKIGYIATIKNSLILSTALLLPSLILSIFLILPFLMLLSQTTKIIFAVIMALCGLIFITLACQSFAQYGADNFTNALYEQQLMSSEKARRKQIRTNSKKPNRK